MQAWICDTTHGVDALTWQTLPMPEPGPGQVLVAIEAVPDLNFSGCADRAEQMPDQATTAFLCGAEFAGHRHGCGRKVTHLKVGSKAAALSGIGWIWHPHAGECGTVHALARWLSRRGCRRFRDLRHLVPRPDRQGRPASGRNEVDSGAAGGAQRPSR